MPTWDAGLVPEMGYLSVRHPYYRVGSGSKPLVVLPGVSDAFSPLGLSRAQAWLLERYYFRRYRDEYTIYVLGRPHGLPAGYSTREMAGGYDDAIDALGYDRVACLGISMGGLIAQHLAADVECVSRLVCSVAGHRLGERGRAILGRWRDWAARGDWFDIICDTIPASYTGYRRWLYPPLLRAARPLVPTPASEADIVTSLEACLAHDSSDVLSAIDVPALVIGGREDRLFSPTVLEATAEGISDGRLELIDGVGHGGYEEQPSAFDGAITAFLDR
jgi:pimeloyl-ACP methyl ester carboxylesterase